MDNFFDYFPNCAKNKLPKSGQHCIIKLLGFYNLLDAHPPLIIIAFDTQNIKEIHEGDRAATLSDLSPFESDVVMISKDKKEKDKFHYFKFYHADSVHDYAVFHAPDEKEVVRRFLSTFCSGEQVDISKLRSYYDRGVR